MRSSPSRSGVRASNPKSARARVHCAAHGGLAMNDCSFEDPAALVAATPKGYTERVTARFRQLAAILEGVSS